jgi:2-polyprenyl-3-methyl-5-hydroxy-6-metoxy-1,4-benzoquinol methylase
MLFTSHNTPHITLGNEYWEFSTLKREAISLYISVIYLRILLQNVMYGAHQCTGSESALILVGWIQKGKMTHKNRKKRNFM